VKKIQHSKPLCHYNLNLNYTIIIYNPINQESIVVGFSKG